MNQTPNQGPRVHHLRRATYIYIALTIIGILLIVALSPWIRTWTPIASGRASDNFLTLIVFIAVAMPVFMFVMVFGFYNLFYFRRNARPERDGPHLVASRGAIIAWVGITTAHALVLFFWGLIFLGRADAAPAPTANVLQVDVTAEQWQFNFTYPQYGNAQSEILELPVNRPVYFTISSIDVVHSFAVPAFGLKEDAVPGVFTHIRVTPNVAGNYSLRCFELCGIYHTYMEAPVRVVDSSAFTSWVGSLKVHGYPWGINGAGPPTSPSSSSLGPIGAYASVPFIASSAINRRLAKNGMAYTRID